MRTRITSIVLGAMTAALLLAGPASATGGKVVITLDVDFGTGVETFTAVGAFCASGEARSDSWVSGHIPGRLQFHVDKVLTCADGSGDLRISLDAVANRGGTIGGWTVAGGTGAYAGAAGGGQITGAGTPDGVIDTYRGSIR